MLRIFPVLILIPQESLQTDGNMFACNSLIAAHKSPRTGNDSPDDAQLGSPATNQPPTSYSINDADELSQLSHRLISRSPIGTRCGGSHYITTFANKSPHSSLGRPTDKPHFSFVSQLNSLLQVVHTLYCPSCPQRISTLCHLTSLHKTDAVILTSSNLE